MEIQLSNLGRRFNREWIFKDLTYSFNSNQNYALLGINGSGKSTLLQVISGALSPSSGSVQYIDSNLIDADDYYQYITIAAPYLELIEDFTLSEMIEFHFKFKKIVSTINHSQIIDLLAMGKNKNKLIKFFSSGMKQRVKLVLAFCSDTPIILLDEPTSNLDKQGVQWYLNLVDKFCKNRLTIIGSNQPEEYSFCNNHINLVDYK